MTVKDIIQYALMDAIDWQMSLADSYPQGAPERITARMRAADYRKILERRYGTGNTYSEMLFKDAKRVPVQQIGTR